MSVSKLTNLPLFFQLKGPCKLKCFSFGVILVTPALIHSVYSFQGSRESTVFGIQYTGSILALISSCHSGLQAASFGSPVRSLTFHPMFALKRFALPSLPFGIAFLSVSSLRDSPQVSIRNLLYCVGFNLCFDSLARFVRSTPRWLFYTQIGLSSSLCTCLLLLSLSPCIIPAVCLLKP